MEPFYENSERLLDVNYFCKNAPPQFFGRVLNTLVSILDFFTSFLTSFKPFIHNVKKLPNILQKSCGVNTARFLKYVWPFSTLCMKGLKCYEDLIETVIAFLNYCKKKWTRIFSAIFRTLSNFQDGGAESRYLFQQKVTSQIFHRRHEKYFLERLCYKFFVFSQCFPVFYRNDYRILKNIHIKGDIAQFFLISYLVVLQLIQNYIRRGSLTHPEFIISPRVVSLNLLANLSPKARSIAQLGLNQKPLILIKAFYFYYCQH